MKSNLTSINVYKNTSTKQGIVTELLYGETFKIIKKRGLWLKIKNDADRYKGFVKKKNFSSYQQNTHKVYKLYAHLYTKPNIKNKTEKKLSFNSKIKVSKQYGSFFKFDNLWIKKKDLKKIKYKNKNIFTNINQFINTKYKWGGKSFKGVDCSGLVQLYFNFNNRYCPRDTKDQIKYFKKKIKFKNIKKNDLIFWKGHVAIAISKKKLIHAYGPLKKTVCMPINKTVNRIYKTANLKVIGIRRVS